MPKAFLVGQTVAHEGHCTPPEFMCFASIWFLTWSLRMEVNPQDKHCHWDESVLVMLLRIISSSAGGKGIQWHDRKKFGTFFVYFTIWPLRVMLPPMQVHLESFASGASVLADGATEANMGNVSRLHMLLHRC